MNASTNDFAIRSVVTIVQQPATPDWQGLRMATWLKAAEAAKFDVFLTVDQGLEYQQNLTGRKIAIIIFRRKSNRLQELLQLVQACLERIRSVHPGQIVSIEAT